MTHVYDMIARTVAQENIGACFALLGDANMNFATSLAESDTQMIYVRHEHCAAAAAMAYARKTAKVGFVTVTCGPGLTQLMTALPAAVRAHIPMVIIAGEAPLKTSWYNQGIDQAPFVTATGAAYHSLHWPKRMPTAIRDAFVQARIERRPVVLGIPFDLQKLKWEGDLELPCPSAEVMRRTKGVQPNLDDLENAITTINTAQNIVVMAGLGVVASNAGAACRKLAEVTDGLLATSLPARGVFWDDPFCIGIAGGFSTDFARQELQKADLIIAVGCSLSKHNSDGGKLWPDATVLQIDIDPKSMNQGIKAADVHLRADAKLGVEALLKRLEERAPVNRSIVLSERINSTPADGAVFPKEIGVHDPRDVVAALDAAIPQGWQLVNSSGHCSYYFAQMPNRPQDEFLTIREFGAIGNGTSFAMGVAVAEPDKPVVLFDGDGSLLMHIQELETCLRHKLNILVIVMNDGGYGSEIHKLRAEGLSEVGASFGRTDIGAIACGFGVSGRTIETLSDIPNLIQEFDRCGGIAVWDVPVSDKIMSPVMRRAHPLPVK